MLAGELVEMFDLDVVNAIQNQISLFEELNTGEHNLCKQK